MPAELDAEFQLVLQASASAREALVAAEQAAAAGDVALAERLVEPHIAHLWSSSGRLALMGFRCGTADPARAAAAGITVADGALSVTHPNTNVLQRFDIER